MRLDKLNRVYQDKKFDEACKFIHDYVEPIIKEAIQVPPHPRLLDEKVTIASRSAAAAAAAVKQARLSDPEKAPVHKTVLNG